MNKITPYSSVPFWLYTAAWQIQNTVFIIAHIKKAKRNYSPRKPNGNSLTNKNWSGYCRLA
jgi:hypothetical protein